MAAPWFSGVVDGSPGAWSGRFWVLGGATVARSADVTWWPIGAYEPSADRWLGLANAPRQAQPLSMTWTEDRLFVLAIDSSAWTFTPEGAVIPGDESP